MASPYALPSSALPHAHQQHLQSSAHGHSRSHSQTPATSQSPLNGWKTTGANGSAHGPRHENRSSRSDACTYSHPHHPSLGEAASHPGGPEEPAVAPLGRVAACVDPALSGARTMVIPAFDESSVCPHSPLGSHSHCHGYDDGCCHDDVQGPQQHQQHHHHHHHHDHNAYHRDGHGQARPYQTPCSHAHDHDAGTERSWLTRMLLPHTARFPVLHAIMTEKDSRRIFYFMTLNFSFMTIQAFYGYVTDSLGLLSDSIHMFFDCVALFMGLLAAVMSKWPPSQRFPFGFGKIEALSGFANGVLLMLLSVEIGFEAFERLRNGTETKRLGELFVVSTLGLLVNLVGMMAFGHHHGHDHGHEPAHAHEDHDGGRHGHRHSHGHKNENMHGIYLHVLADTLGSVSVIVSTVLTHFLGWAGWDPLASCLIAVLIFLSAQPLVSSSARRLLLSVPQHTEYNLRNALDQIPNQKGVVGYTTPKFWMDDSHGGDGPNALVGVVHVTAGRAFTLDEVRERVRGQLRQEGIEAVVQVEREGDSCWCVRGRGPAGPSTPKPY